MRCLLQSAGYMNFSLIPGDANVVAFGGEPEWGFEIGVVFVDGVFGAGKEVGAYAGDPLGIDGRGIAEILVLQGTGEMNLVGEIVACVPLRVDAGIISIQCELPTAGEGGGLFTLTAKNGEQKHGQKDWQEKCSDHVGGG